MKPGDIPRAQQLNQIITSYISLPAVAASAPVVAPVPVVPVPVVPVPASAPVAASIPVAGVVVAPPQPVGRYFDYVTSVLCQIRTDAIANQSRLCKELAQNQKDLDDSTQELTWRRAKLNADKQAADEAIKKAADEQNRIECALKDLSF
jgi:hypothetical protein